MMSALAIPAPPRQVSGDGPSVFAEVLDDGVNLAVWQRPLPAALAAFAEAVLARGAPLAESRVLELIGEEGVPELDELLPAFADLPGHAEFIADLSWLVGAFACLLDARRLGLRLRALDKAMCPRFHVDHVPVRLITSYAGPGSQWLEEGAMARRRLGDAQAEPQDAALIRQLRAGDVALAKGERWQGNEGRGLIHRSPQPQAGERRLLLTLDWLA